MREMDMILQRHLGRSSREIEERVTWFYAYLLHPPALKGQRADLLSKASSILFPRDRAVMRPPKGPREAAARKRETLLKKDFLRAQLRDIVEAYADALRMRGKGAPQAIREKLEDRLAGFVEETARDLSGHVQQGLMREQPVGEMTARLRGAFEEAGKSAGGYAAYCYGQSGWMRVLQAMAHEGQETLLFVSEDGEHTCGRCAGLNGKAFTLYELIEQELLPPLHPNCRCVLIPYDAAQYWGRDRFGELTVVKEPEEIGWWTRALRNLLRVPSDAWEMLKGFGAAEAERLSRGDILDYITLGMISGFIESFVDRGKVMMEEPGLYTVLNFLSLGFLETAEGAFLPEEPLSLEHLLDIAAVVTVVYGAAKTAKRAAAKQSKPAKTSGGGGKQAALPKGRNKANLGNKVDFMFGKGMGNRHNIERSKALKAQLNRIGFQDTPSSREYLINHLNEVLNDASNISKVETRTYIAKELPGTPAIEYVATTRESLLMGPGGGLKIESVWDGDRLLTIIVKGGE